MLTKNQLQEIREYLENSQNPLFLFDNDTDGLCSFILLQRALGRGKGVPVKTYPDLQSQYIRKVNEFNPDAVFILDKAEVSKEFIDEITQRNIPIVWIDHHQTSTPQELINKTNYYNTYPSAEPVTYIAQKVFNRQEDLFLALIGCISDVYMPSFGKSFSQKYPELFNFEIPAFDALHITEIGKFAKMLNYGMMNTTTNVVRLIRYLQEIKGPYDLLEENSKTKEFHRRYQELQGELEKLVKKAQRTIDIKDKIILFIYEGRTSMSAILSNQLSFENKNKIIIVAYKKPDKINLSIRGKNALEITNKIISQLEGSTGGGHIEATGAMIPITQFEKFKKIVKEMNE